uniref:Putative conserved secreted protein n=1 Tax=Panstrongylus lignarius TaxID=156445 RepID=A0A224XPZ7_9HEMI
MYAKVFVCLAILAVTYGAPNHLKAVVVEKQVSPANGVAVGNLGASASWGGYSARAGLGGSADGGGLFAGASAPAGAASAGIGGGSSASAGASASGGAGVKGTSGGGFFDSIFNIPISVLHSVNRHLNTRGKAVTVHGAGAGATASAGAVSGVGFKSADTGTGASAGGTVTVRQNYDSAFAIPIAALTSVNQFLNGK